MHRKGAQRRFIIARSMLSRGRKPKGVGNQPDNMRTVIEKDGWRWTDYTGREKPKHTLPTFRVTIPTG